MAHTNSVVSRIKLPTNDIFDICDKDAVHSDENLSNKNIEDAWDASAPTI